MKQGGTRKARGERGDLSSTMALTGRRAAWRGSVCPVTVPPGMSRRLLATRMAFRECPDPHAPSRLSRSGVRLRVGHRPQRRDHQQEDAREYGCEPRARDSWSIGLRPACVAPRVATTVERPDDQQRQRVDRGDESASSATLVTAKAAKRQRTGHSPPAPALPGRELHRPDLRCTGAAHPVE